MLLRQHSQQTFAAKILQKYLPKFVVSSENLPGSVEITRLKSDDGQTVLAGVVNYQEELPNLPLYNVKISFDTGFVPSSVKRASDGKVCKYSVCGRNTVIEIDRLDDGDILEFNR